MTQYRYGDVTAVTYAGSHKGPELLLLHSFESACLMVHL